MIKRIFKKCEWLILFISLLIITQFIFANIKLLKIPAPAQDFEVFYLSGQQVINKQNPYLQLGKDIVRNPPPALLLFSLFPLFPVLVSQTLWFIASMVLFILGSFILFKILGILDKDKLFNVNNWKLWVFYLSLVFLFFPFRYNLGSGQVNNLLFLLLCQLSTFPCRKEIFYQDYR